MVVLVVIWNDLKLFLKTFVISVNLVFPIKLCWTNDDDDELEEMIRVLQVKRNWVGHEMY